MGLELCGAKLHIDGYNKQSPWATKLTERSACFFYLSNGQITQLNTTQRNSDRLMPPVKTLKETYKL